MEKNCDTLTLELMERAISTGTACLGCATEARNMNADLAELKHHCLRQRMKRKKEITVTSLPQHLLKGAIASCSLWLQEPKLWNGKNFRHAVGAEIVTKIEVGSSSHQLWA